MDYLLCLGGLAVLVICADHFVRGASAIGSSLKISPVVTGIIFLGFGTSLPEALVSATAARTGNIDLAIGNIIGSNITNLTLILAVAAFFAVMKQPNPGIKKEAFITTLASLVFAFFVYEDRLNIKLQGVFLILLGVWAVIYFTRSTNSVIENPMNPSRAEKPKQVNHLAEAGRVIIGLTGTVMGAHFTVTGAENLAETWGMSGGFVGFTLIAIGTSLPELATVITCAKRGETDLIFGNVFGSNIFNCLIVGGIFSISAPQESTNTTMTEEGLIYMLVVTVIALVVSSTGKRIRVREGVLLVGVYLLATTFVGIHSHL